MKKLREIKENHLFMVRSKKRLPKIKNFKFSPKLKELRRKIKDSIVELKDSISESHLVIESNQIEDPR